MIRHAIIAAALSLGVINPAGAQVAPAAAPAAAVIDTMSLRADTRFLADDVLLGRGTGTAGERMAAAYIASRLVQLGLEPLGEAGSHFLPIPLRTAHIDPTSSVTIRTARDSSVMRNGQHFIVNTGGHGAFRDFSGPAVFMGQPVHAARLLAAESALAGRVAVFLGPLGGAALELMPALERAGVSGIIILVTDDRQYDLYVRSRGESRFFVDAPVDDPVWQPSLPVLIAGPDMAEVLLVGIDVPTALLQGTATRALDLLRSVDARIRVTVEDVPAANVGGVLRGSDPALRDEYVVYTAHYDHLGVSTPDARGDSIYNGFSDNAAGVAMLLAIAQALRDDPPARSVAFLFFTGEERGLLGSSYLASAPPFPLDRIRGLINLDAGAPPAPPVRWNIAGGDASPMGATAQRVAERNGWTAIPGAANPNSDHWPFLSRGVPAIFIIPGDEWENVTREERDALRARWDRYHQAGDHYFEDFPFRGLERYAEYALRVGMEAAGGGH